MHDKAATAVEKKIRGTLLSAQVVRGFPIYSSVETPLLSLADETLKHKKEWIDNQEIINVVYEFIHTTLTRAQCNENSEPLGLWDLLGQETAEGLVQEILLFFLSIPRTYKVYLPLDNLRGNFPSALPADTNWGFVLVRGSNLAPTTPQLISIATFPYFEETMLKPDKVYLCQRIDGYFGTQSDGVTIRRAINNFKIVMQLGVVKGIFEANTKGIKKDIIFEGSKHFRIPRQYLITEDLLTQGKSQTELFLEISEYVSMLDYNIKGKEVPLLKFREDADITETILRVAQDIFTIADCNEEEARRIKASLQWYFDSCATKNKTLSFVQVCIGLEAILGDDAYNGILTETLADRCSYLICNDLKSRKRIKAAFKELYGARSKIVHGNATELDLDQQHHLHMGTFMLRQVITKESEYLLRMLEKKNTSSSL